MSYMSLTVAVSPASGPSTAPWTGSLRSCGTNAERTATPLGGIAADAGRGSGLLQVPVEDLRAVPAHNAGPAQQLGPQPLDVADAVRRARQVGMVGDRHDLRPLGRFLVQALEVVHRPQVHLLGAMVLQCHHDDVVQL